MEPIRPLHEEHVKRFCGMPVCAVLRDGTRHMGILSACQGGRIYLNGGENYLQPMSPRVGVLGNTAKGKGAKKTKAVQASKPEQNQEKEVHTQAYPFGPGYYGGYYPYGYGYGYGFGAAAAVDLAALAFLFLLI
jgi:hypothetical protein